MNRLNPVLTISNMFFFCAFLKVKVLSKLMFCLGCCFQQLITNNLLQVRWLSRSQLFVLCISGRRNLTVPYSFVMWIGKFGLHI